MNPFFLKLLHAGVLCASFLERILVSAGSWFRRKGDPGRRASGWLRALARREMEIERLDRLRNPGDYRGR